MTTLLTLTLSGSTLTLLLLALRYLLLKRMPSTVYYYAWLLVLLRFVHRPKESGDRGVT